MRAKYAISLTASSGDYVYLFTAHIAAPLNLYMPYSVIQPLGSGGVRGAGWARATWYWASLEETERTFFRTYCAGLFAKDIYIRTLNHNNTWISARTNMFWMPEGEDWQNGNTLGFTLGFKIKSVAVVN